MGIPTAEVRTNTAFCQEKKALEMVKNGQLSRKGSTSRCSGVEQ